MKSGALPRPAVDCDLPGVLGDDPVGDRQPESSATRLSRFGCSLSSKKWIVNLIDMLRRNARTGIAYSYFHRRAVGSLYTQRAALYAHGVLGI